MREGLLPEGKKIKYTKKRGRRVLTCMIPFHSSVCWRLRIRTSFSRVGPSVSEDITKMRTTTNKK